MKTLKELKEEIQQYQYMEDTSIIDASIASILANRLKLGDPVWFLIIGASSGGKSQILRPVAIGDNRFIHRIDDITENTFLSGAKTKEGEVSLLKRIGSHGIISISDFTVIMSKSKESRATILSQLRMVYDGEMTKQSGNQTEPITWAGYMGMIAGSTPSIYAHFEEVSDMGERFIYYRMKEINEEKATRLALSRDLFGKELDEKLALLYGEYIREVMNTVKKEDITLPQNVQERIIEVSLFAERVRTNAHKDWKGTVNRIPVPALPMRIALQITAIAKGLGAMKFYETGKVDFTEEDLSIIDWIGYSLANEENRACLKVIASIPFDLSLTTTTIADRIGLDSTIVRIVLQNLSAVGILSRNGDESSLTWRFKALNSYNIVRRIEHIKGVEVIENRKASEEDAEEHARELDRDLEMFGVN